MKIITIDEKKYKLVPVEEEVSRVEVGMKFKCNPGDQTITILEINRNRYIGKWSNGCVDSYFIDTVERFLKEGTWIEVSNSKIPNNSEYPKILSFKDSDGDVWKLMDDNNYSYISLGGCPIEGMLKGVFSVEDGSLAIHSVAKSSTEVFTVGDETQFGKIESFEIHTFIDGNSNNCHQIWANINTMPIDVKKLIKAPERKPLFTTDDGKEIYYDDVFFDVVNWETGKVIASPSCNHTTCFSTEEAAKAYIRENKPEFSRKQIREAMKNSCLGNSMGENGNVNVIHGEKLENLLEL